MFVFVLAMKTGIAQDISVKGVVMEEKLDGSLVPVEFANGTGKIVPEYPHIQHDIFLLLTQR